MKNRIFCLLFVFSFFSSYGQTVYTFLTEMSGPDAVPSFTKINGFMVYSGSNPTEASFYANYQILAFEKAFPESAVSRTLNIYLISSYNADFMEDLLSAYPIKYLAAQDITELDSQLTYTYPNDYGSTSPVANLGVPLSYENYDYINVPKAWELQGYGSSSVKIGISDGGVYVNDIDFSGKTTLLTAAGPYNLTGTTWHGTQSAALVAAQGNNANGTIGICSNCSIVSIQYGFGSPGTINNPTPGYNNLLKLAKVPGVRVINMSWGSIYKKPKQLNEPDFYQWVIDEIWAKNIVLVASAHNPTSFQEIYAPNYMPYAYPASYNHVISVTSVNHKNEFGEEVVTLADWGGVSRFVKDMVSSSVVTNYQGNGPYAFANATHITNDLVDICAPGWAVPQYPWYVLGNTDVNGPLYYGHGTSSSAPHVSGTIGLMFSIYDCLINDEAEDILQLSSKSIENLQGNEPFIGRSGSGKLETGDAIEFLGEMKNPTGNALIDGQNFYRFDFKLEHILNKLTISNQTFRDACIADFTAKKVVEILPGTDLKPTAGYTDLKINSGMSACTSRPDIGNESPSNGTGYDQAKKTAKLFPNPNKGSFTIALERNQTAEIDLNILDILGKIVHTQKVQGTAFDINLPNVPSGIYFVRLSSNQLNETLKFIKE